MIDTKNLRQWVESWGRELTWTESNGAKAGSISKVEMLQLLKQVETGQKVEYELARMLGEQSERCEHLRDELEKAARVESFNWAINLLRMCATDPGAAKNYAGMEMAWEKAIAPGLPFRRVCIAFVRDGALSPIALACATLESRDKLAGFCRALVDLAFKDNPAGREHALREVEEWAAKPDANTVKGSIPEPA